MSYPDGHMGVQMVLWCLVAAVLLDHSQAQKIQKYSVVGGSLTLTPEAFSEPISSIKTW